MTNTIKRLILIGLVTAASAACNPLPIPTVPLAPADKPDPFVAACVTDPTDGWVRCFDQYGNRIEEDSNLWSCSDMGNLICGDEPNGSTDGRVHTCGYVTEDGVTEHLNDYADRCGLL